MANDWTGELRNVQMALRSAAQNPGARIMVEALAEQWVFTSKATAPVDTGQLRQRIGVKSSSGDGMSATATVESDVPYSAAVEYGTRYTSSNPYFRRGRDAALDAAAKLGAMVQSDLSRALGSGGVYKPRRFYKLQAGETLSAFASYTSPASANASRTTGP